MNALTSVTLLAFDVAGLAVATFFALELAFRLLIVARVLMRRLVLSTTLAWLLLLLFVPIVGIFFYALIGENRLGERRARRAEEIAVNIHHRASSVWTTDGPRWRAEETETKQLIRLLTTVGGLPPLKGNRLELIGSTPDFIARLAGDIDKAERFCHLLYYIWVAEGRTAMVADALVRAAQRGVACRVLVDAVGSETFLKSDVCRLMREAGVRVLPALNVSPVRMLFARVDLRNHRKIAVMDGKVGYTGSHNLAEASFARRTKPRAGDWVDASVRMEGPAVGALEAVFVGDWLLESDEEPEDIGQIAATPQPIAEGGSVVQVIPSGPGPEPDAIEQGMLSLIYAADRELILTTPYFIPDESMRTALRIAARRGVRTTIVVPARPDSFLIAAASRAFFLEMLEAGVRIRRYRPGLLHAKTITIDGEIGVITSANLDMRSFYLNFESTLIAYDKPFATSLRELQVQYMQDAPEVSLGEWAQRPVGKRFLDNVAQLASPLL